ncbi:schlafen family member 13-like [Rhynchocyon petersi]
MVKQNQVCSLTVEEWVHKMMATDVELDEDFESQLSLSERPPLCRPVYSKKGLEHKADLQRHFFSVPLEHLQYTPEPLWKELSSQHEGLEELINEELRPFSRGILILSRSWAVDLNLQEKQEVICDALLIAQDSPPILYTILEKQDAGARGYSTLTAFTLKQKLVNMGGYTGKVCVLTKFLYLSPESATESLGGAGYQVDYPESYCLAGTQQMEVLLQSLVIVLLAFRSFLNDQLGCEILNLLTAEQYEIFSKNLHNTRELFIHGLPGSGKTIIAMKIMEKIRNIFHCDAYNILYICENEPLKNFINKRVCQAVTRKTFMKNNFEEIQHIIIDEAQNFRSENGNWYWKAKAITQREQDCPGILWIFLDYFQTSHLDSSGLPPLLAQYPREKLTRVVRNADPIANYLKETMQEVRKNPPPNVPAESLEMLSNAEWAQGVSGNFEFEIDLTLKEIVTQVVEKCHMLFRNGYSPKDIAILLSTASEVEFYENLILNEIRRKASQVNGKRVLYSQIMFDSVRRFSGLERNIVFGINPRVADPAVFPNLLLCLASRARKHLYIYSQNF